MGKGTKDKTDDILWLEIKFTNLEQSIYGEGKKAIKVKEI